MAIIWALPPCLKIRYCCSVAVNFQTDLDWQDVRFFVALARFGALSAAARALRVTHATVARRVARLEAQLGVTLFERRPDGYVLTADGSAVLETAQRMEDAAAALNRGGSNKPLSGLVRLTATASLIDGFLLGPLADFIASHPGIDVDVVADVRSLSLARHETDIALRLDRPDDGDLVAQGLAVMSYGAYADAAWRDRLRAGEPAQFVGFDEPNASLPEAVWLARHFPRSRVRLRLGSHISQAAACAAGIGVAILPAYVASLHPQLKPIDLGRRPPSRPLSMLTRQDVRTAPPIRALSRFIAQTFANEQARFQD